jgi:hypothetical protein
VKRARGAEVGHSGEELLELRGTITEAAQRFELDPVLLAALLHHEGGNYLDSLRRNLSRRTRRSAGSGSRVISPRRADRRARK